MENPSNLPPVFQQFQEPKQKGPSTLKLIFGIILLITGIIQILSLSLVFVGLLRLVAGILLFPPTLGIIERALKSRIERVVKYVLILALIFVSLILSVPGSDRNEVTDNKTIQEQPNAIVSNNQFDFYLQNSVNSISLLNEKSKAVRQKALSEIIENPVYKALTSQKIIDQKYLIVLQSIGNTMISSHGDYFEMLVSNEDSLRKIPGALRFVINSVQLDMYGGIPKEILEVYLRYRDAFKVSGSKGTTIYHPDGSPPITIEHDFTLSEALVIFHYSYPVILDEFYEAASRGLLHWQRGKGASYKYPYLNSKIAFNSYLGQNYPDNKNYTKFDVVVTASKLYADYDANEVTADDKYKNKQIAVKGTVEKIAKDIFDEPYITLSTGDFSEIHCSFENSDELKRISKGDYVTLVGTCTGKVSIIVGLTDCQIF